MPPGAEARGGKDRRALPALGLLVLLTLAGAGTCAADIISLTGNVRKNGKNGVRNLVSSLSCKQHEVLSGG